MVSQVGFSYELKNLCKDIRDNVKPSAFAEKSQLDILEKKCKQYREAVTAAWNGKSVIMDGSILSVYPYAYNLYELGFISEACYQKYFNLFSAATKDVLPPHLVIDLHLPFEKCVENVKYKVNMSGRDECFLVITVEYLKGISNAFKKFVMPYYPRVITVDNSVDFEHQRKIQQLMYAQGRNSDLFILDFLCPESR